MVLLHLVIYVAKPFCYGEWSGNKLLTE